MRRYVYEVVSTNIVSGAKDSTYFDSMKAAKMYKDTVERNTMNIATICQWKVFSAKDV